MAMPGRQSGSGYRFGFNGKEKDNEVKGEGNSLDFGARIYDPRIAKFLSVDPLSAKFPYESDYGYAGDNPILCIDQEGKSKTWYIYKTDEAGKTTMTKIVNDRDIRFRLPVVENFYSMEFQSVTYDVSQQLFIDAKGNTQMDEERYEGPSKLSLFQSFKLSSGITNGVQNFGYNVYSSSGVNSQAFEEIKGRATIVENFNINDLILPSIPNRKITTSIATLGEVNKELKVVLKVFMRQAEFSQKLDKLVETTVEKFGSSKPIQPEAPNGGKIHCAGCDKDIPSTDTLKPGSGGHVGTYTPANSTKETPTTATTPATTQ